MLVDSHCHLDFDDFAYYGDSSTPAFLTKKDKDGIYSVFRPKTDKSFKINSDDAFVIASRAHAGTELSFARILDKLYKTNKEYRVVTFINGNKDIMQIIKELIKNKIT